MNKTSYIPHVVELVWKQALMYHYIPAHSVLTHELDRHGGRGPGFHAPSWLGPAPALLTVGRVRVVLTGQSVLV